MRLSSGPDSRPSSWPSAESGTPPLETQQDLWSHSSNACNDLRFAPPSGEEQVYLSCTFVAKSCLRAGALNLKSAAGRQVLLHIHDPNGSDSDCHCASTTVGGSWPSLKVKQTIQSEKIAARAADVCIFNMRIKMDIWPQESRME
ncbi:hypothetical protein SRHO_G00001260 [Serrasalmus rhombeus]